MSYADRRRERLAHRLARHIADRTVGGTCNACAANFKRITEDRSEMLPCPRHDPEGFIKTHGFRIEWSGWCAIPCHCRPLPVARVHGAPIWCRALALWRRVLSSLSISG